MAEAFVLGALLWVLIGIGVLIYRKMSEAAHPDRPRKPELEPLGGRENLRRKAEYKRELAEWRAARRHH